MPDSSSSRRCWSRLSARVKFSDELPGSPWACSTAWRTLTRRFSAMARDASSRRAPEGVELPGRVLSVLGVRAPTLRPESLAPIEVRRIAHRARGARAGAAKVWNASSPLPHGPHQPAGPSPAVGPVQGGARTLYAFVMRE